MFIEPTITWSLRGSGYIWLDTKIVFKKKFLIDGCMVDHLSCRGACTLLRRKRTRVSVVGSIPGFPLSRMDEILANG